MTIGLSFFSFSNYVKIACSSARFPHFLGGETPEPPRLKRALTSGPGSDWQSVQPGCVTIAHPPLAGPGHCSGLQPRIISIASDVHACHIHSVCFRISQDLAKDLAMLAREIHDVAGEIDSVSPAANDPTPLVMT